jgi:hypothetical protein
MEVSDAQGRTAYRWEPGARGRDLPVTPGLQRVSWDLRYQESGVKAPPGGYSVRMSWDGGSAERPLRVVPDPRDPAVTQADYDEQFRVSMEVADTLAAVRAAVARIRSVRQQADSLVAWAAEGGRDTARLRTLVDALADPLADLERALASVDRTDGPAGRRTLAGLDRQYGSLLSHLNSSGGYGPGSTEGRPTAGALERQVDLDARWRELEARLGRVLATELAAFNAEVARLGGDPVVVRE